MLLAGTLKLSTRHHTSLRASAGGVTREYMAASRRLLLVGFTPLFSSTCIHPTSYSPHLRFTNKTPLSSKPRFLYTNVTSSVDAVIDTTTAGASSHPWPEWVEFMDKLKLKGYFDETLDDNDDASTITKKELNILRNACLSFARHRFDLFRSLSREHIQVVVECGCPSLFRKAVNSAKRLRATFGLDEGDVCRACNLRGSCDRAYGILKDSEASARTVDIVRMLLIYALDPLVLSGGEKPHGRERIEAAARKLLFELCELSETTPDPSLPKPAVKLQRRKQEKIKAHEASQNVDMKRGDWICSNCDFMNFSKNVLCLECKAERPKGVSVDDSEMKKGDWTCPNCDYINFSRNIRCLQCKTEGPKRTSVNNVEMKKGDWTCTQCQFMNFARNTQCLHCKSERPKRVLLPGDWECPSCDFLNYRRNRVCLKCNCDRPKDEVAEYDEQIWRKPY